MGLIEPNKRGQSLEKSEFAGADLTGEGDMRFLLLPYRMCGLGRT